MFFANIAIAEKYDYLDDKFRAAYKWLRETDINALADGSYPILGDEVIANVQRYETEPAEKRRFEFHKEYFDIQYMVAGTEFFGLCRADLLENPEEMGGDLYFCDEPALSGGVVLHEGDLVIVAPEDGHKPRCAAGESMPVVKVVVKVKV